MDDIKSICCREEAQDKGPKNPETGHPCGSPEEETPTGPEKEEARQAQGRCRRVRQNLGTETKGGEGEEEK